MMTCSLYNASFAAMGGRNEVRYYARSDSEANEVARLVEDEVRRIEAKYSRYREDSILSQINRAAGESRVALDEETAGLLRFANECYLQSDGLFDITTGVLRRVWNFKEQQVPTEESLALAHSLVGWDKVNFDGSSIELPLAGMEIDLGGIGKEYAVDRSATLLLENGIEHGYLNFAGDIRVVGPHTDGSAWRIGVRNPRSETDVFAGVLLRCGALATSGDYERFMIVDGVRYCHILNPRTGWPVQELQCVAVLAESCLIAGTLATTAMLLGEEAAEKMLCTNEVQHLMVTQSGEVLRYPNDLFKESHAVSAGPEEQNRIAR